MLQVTVPGLRDERSLASWAVMAVGSEDLGTVLAAQGYVCIDGKPDAAIAATLGRVGSTSDLLPRDNAEADPWSLSGRYGLAAFPWHTDGAISMRPPRWLALRAVRLSKPTSTHLLEPDSGLLSALRGTVLRVRDRAGRVRHLPAALPDGARWCLRWDPRICSPRGKLSVDEVEAQQPTSVIDWRPNRLLIIDNTRLFHRRPAVDSGSDRLIERTYIWDD